MDTECDMADIWIPYADSEHAELLEKVLDVDDEEGKPYAEEWPPGLYGLDLNQERLEMIKIAQGADRNDRT